ncbi:hypothetical protein K438DRAFT_1584541 [Mycena galopus ATCC 62051]|nr:hypothetical protein K438DRAFT_1584541 [Mycena galopus ATCC 62051]
MATPRIVVVDDTDPAINYTANQWFPSDVTKLDPLGILGPVWNGTIHSTIVDGATFTFNFNGTSIDVIGTNSVTTLTDGTFDPQWSCTVDQIPIADGTNEQFTSPENNWLFCNQETLNPGPHTLTMKVQSKSTPFYFDTIRYTPLPGVEIDGAVVDYAFGDPAITYSSGWAFHTTAGNTANITQTNGAQVTLDFHGTAVSLGGYIPQELPPNATTAKYSIDGGAATTFPLAGLGVNGVSLFNVPLFNVSGLTPGDHSLVVTYLGDSNHTPLVVKDFFVTNSVRN